MLSRTAAFLALLSFSLINAQIVVSPGALGISGDPVEGEATRASTSDPCGGVDVAQNLNAATPVVAAADGTFSCTVFGFTSGTDGSRSVSANVDPTGSGNAGAFSGQVTVSQNGDADPTGAGQNQITAALPSGTTCSGGTAGNLCLVSFVSPGGFGNCVVVQFDGTDANATPATGNNGGTTNNDPADPSGANTNSGDGNTAPATGNNGGSANNNPNAAGANTNAGAGNANNDASAKPAAGRRQNPNDNRPPANNGNPPPTNTPPPPAQPTPPAPAPNANNRVATGPRAELDARQNRNGNGNRPPAANPPPPPAQNNPAPAPNANNNNNNAAPARANNNGNAANNAPGRAPRAEIESRQNRNGNGHGNGNAPPPQPNPTRARPPGQKNNGNNPAPAPNANHNAAQAQRRPRAAGTRLARAVRRAVEGGSEML